MKRFFPHPLLCGLLLLGFVARVFQRLVKAGRAAVRKGVTFPLVQAVKPRGFTRAHAWRSLAPRVTAPLLAFLMLMAFGGIAHAATQYAKDTFTAADGVLLSAHTSDTGGTWSKVAGDSYPSPSILGNKIKGDGTLPAAMLYTQGASESTLTADYGVAFTLSYTTANYGYSGVILRGQASGERYGIWQDAQNGIWQIYYVPGPGYGGFQSLATVNLPVGTPAGARYIAEIVGSTISVRDSTGTVILSVTDTRITTAGKPGLTLGQEGTGGPSDNTYRIDDWRVLSPKAARTNGWVYVSPSSGDDELGQVYPGATTSPTKFATINAAMRALLPGTSTSRNTVILYNERYAPVIDGVYYPAAGYSTSLLYPYTSWQGAGMPQVAPNGRTLVDGTGTIIDGRFFCKADGVQVYRLGIDGGLDAIAARGLSANDVFSLSWQHNQGNPTEIPLIVGVVGKDIVALACPNTTYHAALLERTSGAYLQNIRGIYGFAGFVSKNVGLVVRQVLAQGQYNPSNIGAGVYVKSNSYADNTGERAYDVRIEGFTATGGGTSVTAAPLRFLNEGGTLDDNLVDGISLAGAVVLGNGGTNIAGNIVTSDGTSYGAASAPATVATLTLTLNGGKTLASAVVLPANAPQYVRYSIAGAGAKIDSYTGVIDLSNVANGTQVTVTALSYYGTNATAVQTSQTFTKGANVFRRVANPERRGVRSVQ